MLNSEALDFPLNKINEQNFEWYAIQTFIFQYNYNSIYKEYCQLIGVIPNQIKTIHQIPFLPISLFKTKKILIDHTESEIEFSSSSTTGQGQSIHPVASLKLYQESFLQGFKFFYGDIKNYCILGLLPGYLERQGSSLIYMVQKLINESNHPQSGFYLNNMGELSETIQLLENKKQPTILIGVTYALFDFAKLYPQQLKHVIVMETGGMKGRDDIKHKSEFYEILTKQLGCENIHSEYGMTELLSQAYSKKNGIYNCPPWMKVTTRSVHDPFELLEKERFGALNIIDLANRYSCSFIATDDIGVVHKDDTFELSGRIDNSDLRGCSLLYI